MGRRGRRVEQLRQKMVGSIHGGDMSVMERLVDRWGRWMGLWGLRFSFFIY